MPFFFNIIAASLLDSEASFSISVNTYKGLSNMSTDRVLKHLIHVFMATKRSEVLLKPSRLLVFFLEPLYPN